ncbi:hypothetical protein AB0G71_29400 [Streptomyces sp. NPDC020403]|uniref:hypothetical protein n=1 Tax=unclassified Streptomyces TaxID=2593676 RepID=UPI003402782E
MMITTVRRTGIAVAAVTALMSVAACGGPGGSTGTSTADGGGRSGPGALGTDAVAALRLVQKETGGAQSAMVEGTTVMGSAMSMRQSGAIDWSDGITGALTITYTGGTMGDALKQSGGDGSMRARYLKDEYYANMGDAFAANVGGKHWIRYGYAELAELAGASGEVMKEQMRNSTPQQGVNALLASGDVKKVGQEDVRGVATTHYSGTVDIAELSAKTSALDAGQLAAFKKQLSGLGITTETVDIWVDKDNLLVKKTEKGETKTGALNSTVFYSDYGAKVRVEKPAAGDTVDFKDILGQQQGGTAGAS